MWRIPVIWTTCSSGGTARDRASPQPCVTRWRPTAGNWGGRRHCPRLQDRPALLPRPGLCDRAGTAGALPRTGIDQLRSGENPVTYTKDRLFSRSPCLQPMLENRSTALVKLSMVLSASPCWMPSGHSAGCAPPAPPARTCGGGGLGGVDLGQHILTGHVLVYHAVNSLHLADDLLQPPVQVVRIHTLSHADTSRIPNGVWAYYPSETAVCQASAPQRNRRASTYPWSPWPRMVAAQAARM